MRLKKAPFSIEEEPLINLTPLIDVVFIILIAFILIAPLLEVDRVELATAPHFQKEKEGTKQSGPVNIYVYEDNSIWINGRNIEPSKLNSELKQLHRDYPSEIPRLFHHKHAYFETFEKVKNGIESSGFKELDVILKSE